MQDFFVKIKKLLNNRFVPLAILFTLGFSVILVRMYRLQILTTATEISEESETTEITRDIKATRGNIYDRNGVLLTKNNVSYSVAISNTANLNNAAKNEMILNLLNLLEGQGYDVDLDFGLDLNSNGTVSFNLEDNALLRFKKNVYMHAYVSQLSAAERAATAMEVFNYLRYGSGSTKMFNIDESYSMEDAYKIMVLRYNLLIQNPQYTQIILAANVDDVTLSAVKESLGSMPGVEIVKTMTREYCSDIYMSQLLGYTGLITDSERESMNAARAEITPEPSILEVEGADKLSMIENASNDLTAANAGTASSKTITDYYTSDDYVGKTGVEKSMENYLGGTKGTSLVTLDASGKVIKTEVVSEPKAGDDVYLTIDYDLQRGIYAILKKNVAAVLISKITNSYSYGTKGTSASGIQIPIYEVYNALIANNVIDITQFSKEDASELEKQVYSIYKTESKKVIEKLSVYFAKDNKVLNSDTGETMSDYLSYCYSVLTSNGIIDLTKVDKTDEFYLDYSEGLIPLSKLLLHAVASDWIDLDKLGITEAFLSTDEIYSRLYDYLIDYFANDTDFEKKVYRTLIFDKQVTGTQLCLLLLDQEAVKVSEAEINGLKNGSISPYDYIIGKLKSLEIEPAQLALEPCSASCVVVDVNTGKALAVVSYPGYDNNKLANKIDYEYYSKLLDDESYPLMDRPTQQRTATGSTFKPLMSFAGFGEGVITPETYIQDKGVFELVVPSPKCWRYPRNHGYVNVSSAIQHSCNYFYYQIGYWLSLDAREMYNDALGISKIQSYASMFGFDSKSGIETEELEPIISDTDAVRTSIGYYHRFAPIQIARYVTAIANKGTVFDISMIDKEVDQEGNVVHVDEPVVHNQITQFSDAEWNSVQKGMWMVVNTSADSLDKLYKGAGAVVAGKTGTAQVSLNHPNHGLFISYAPYEKPEISVTVVLPNAYTSANAAYVAREVYGLYFKDENKEDLLSGNYTAGNATSINISD